jgi:hydroxymethylpyrimidine/phosphomethylpyrimidine kinase
MTPRILIIAGSDSGGGAGIQADIKTVTMLSGHAMTAITAITAQNTLGVQAVHPVPTEIVMAQIESCVGDIGVDAVKIGMIGSAETAQAVAARLERLTVPIVFDPVMVSTSGSVLADAATIAAFERLMAIATVTTPNLPELAALGGEATVQASARALLVKGGHGEGAQLADRLLDRGGEIASWSDARIETTSTHGTGCTLASAIAVGLAEGRSLAEAVARGRTFVRLALREAPGLGNGHGPMGQQDVRLDVGPDMRLNQFVLPHSDYDATRDFYRRLGLTLIVDSPGNEYARFEAPGGATLSIHGDDAGVNFECADLDAQVAKARAAGIEFEGPVEQPWLWREAWTRDPSGNRVLLFSAGENRRFPPWRLP